MRTAASQSGPRQKSRTLGSSVFEDWGMTNNRHEEHLDIAKYIFMIAPPDWHSAITSCLVENVYQTDDSARQACIVC